MEIKKVNISELIPAVYNPRIELQKEDKEYQNLKNSIQKFGYVEPIIVNKVTNTIVGGHQRLNVLKDLGYTDIDVIYVELDKENEKLLNIALNKIDGFWDNEKLSNLLKDLKATNDNIDLSLTGFDTHELDTLLTDLNTDLEIELHDLFQEKDDSKRKEEEYIFSLGDIKIHVSLEDYNIILNIYNQNPKNYLIEKLKGE